MLEEITRENHFLDHNRLVRQVVQSHLWLPLEGPSHSTLDCLSMKSDLDIGMSLPRALGHEMPPQL